MWNSRCHRVLFLSLFFLCCKTLFKVIKKQLTDFFLYKKSFVKCLILLSSVLALVLKQSVNSWWSFSSQYRHNISCISSIKFIHERTLNRLYWVRFNLWFIQTLIVPLQKVSSLFLNTKKKHKHNNTPENNIIYVYTCELKSSTVNLPKKYTYKKTNVV